MEKRIVQPGRAEAAANALAAFTWPEFGAAWAELLAFLEAKTFSREEADAGINLHVQHGRLSVIHPPTLPEGLSLECATILTPTNTWGDWVIEQKPEPTRGPFCGRGGFFFNWDGAQAKLKPAEYRLALHLWKHGGRSKVDDVIDDMFPETSESNLRPHCSKLGKAFLRGHVPLEVHCEGGEVWWEDTNPAAP